MTLGLGIVSPWGAWISTDFRVTWSNGGLKTDDSQKHLIVRCPDGGLLLGYTGLAEVGGESVNDWVRGILRGSSRTLLETANLICSEATGTLAPICTLHRIHHTFMFAAFSGQIRWDGTQPRCDEQWAGLITNMENRLDCDGVPPRREFSVATMKVGDAGYAWAVGSGRSALGTKDRNLLARVAGRAPSSAKDYRRLLGRVNERVAGRASATVSSSCAITYMPPTIEPFESEFSIGGATKRPLGLIPMISLGMDLTFMGEVLMRSGKMAPEELEKAWADAAVRTTETAPKRR